MASTECLVVGHRGFKGKHTENTLHGFESCFDTGATLFETDVWTTRDHVLVISHDVNTKRVFCDRNGNETNYNILQTDYADLKDLRTIGSGEPLLTFQDLLRWFKKYVEQLGSEGAVHKVHLDLKNANPPILLKLLLQDMAAVHADLAWWFPRIQIGVWNLRFVKYLNQDPFFQDIFGDTKPYLGYPHFDIFHISTSWQDSLTYAAYNEYLAALPDKRFKLPVTGVSIIYISTWTRGFLTDFLPAAKEQDWKLYSWTINRPAQLQYFTAVGRHAQIREYGVITDYPDKMVELLKEKLEKEPTPAKLAVPYKFRFFTFIFLAFMRLAGPLPVLSKGSFATPVDPMQIIAFRPRWSYKVFALLQKLGIF